MRLTTGANRSEEITLYLGLGGIPFGVLDGEELCKTLRELIARLSSALLPGQE